MDYNEFQDQRMALTDTILQNAANAHCEKDPIKKIGFLRQVVSAKQAKQELRAQKIESDYPKDFLDEVHPEHGITHRELFMTID